MNLKDITILTVSFNNNLLTGMMLKSFSKQVGELPEVVIVDNGNKIPVDDSLKFCFNVVDNFNHKLLSDELQPSRNHSKSIDFALKNLIKTEWCLLVDNDILFKPEIKTFLETLDSSKFDCCGKIGWDVTPPDRLFPYFCLINVNKFRKENLNYFDRNRTIAYDMPGHKNAKKENHFDTGYSFYEDIKSSWIIKEIEINNFISHCHSGSFISSGNKYIKWLSDNKNLI